ncbi:hypothetical protein FP2506_11342 [Fulvimarina pelagi HTCC2506]|uniref:Uncharacterized protein n=1 Tax=Fulvimarina pelagi HTCC2506 TaxID=314231 RepID=Q0FZ11_9HYPH|nr:phage major tail tube protein [Fulvimarina pelagi]EAU40147.1 hypothetical protein FP2506_11342 [Fulvimarina pelagi HTCC2506]
MDSIIHGANWYVGEINCKKRLEAVALPDLRMARERMAFGWFGFELPTDIEPPTFEFGVYGSHRDLQSRFGREAGDWTTFTYYERLRDITKGQNKGRVVIIKALIMDVRHPRVIGKRADATRYGGGGVWFYHDIFDGETIHKFSVENQTLVIDGIDYSSEGNRLIAA